MGSHFAREVTVPDVVGGFDTVGARYIGRERSQSDGSRVVANVVETNCAHGVLEIGQCLRNAVCVGGGAARSKLYYQHALAPDHLSTHSFRHSAARHG
jgi:hypothetical protein